MNAPVAKPRVTPEGRIHWLTGIPPHWQVVPSKWLFTESKDRARPGDEQLSATQAYGVILQADFEAREGRQVVHVHRHLDKRKHVRLDDFVISMRSFQGGLERAWASGAIRSSYVVLRPSDQVHPAFFGHLFKSTAYIQALQATSNFIRDGQDLNFNNFTLVNLPHVPLEEQRAIADFLDEKTAAIDALIEKKERLIALLAEKRAALIHQAVTKGLDPTVPMKPSGIPWIGDIPAHWQLKKLKHAAGDAPRFGLQMGPFGASLTSVSREPDEFFVFGQANTISGNFQDVSRWITATQFTALAQYELRPGDIVLTRKGSLGSCRLVPEELPRGIIDSDTIRLRVDGRTLVPAFLVRVLHEAQYLHTQLDRQRRGAILPGLNTSVVGNLVVASPPLVEQREIAQALEASIHHLNSVVGNVEKQTARLHEYRQALITAAVTGQLDIPGAAA